MLRERARVVSRDVSCIAYMNGEIAVQGEMLSVFVVPQHCVVAPGFTLATGGEPSPRAHS